VAVFDDDIRSELQRFLSPEVPQKPLWNFLLQLLCFFPTL